MGQTLAENPRGSMAECFAKGAVHSAESVQWLLPLQPVCTLLGSSGLFQATTFLGIVFDMFLSRSLHHWIYMHLSRLPTRYEVGYSEDYLVLVLLCRWQDIFAPLSCLDLQNWAGVQLVFWGGLKVFTCFYSFLPSRWHQSHTAGVKTIASGVHQQKLPKGCLKILPDGWQCTFAQPVSRNLLGYFLHPDKSDKI